MTTRASEQIIEALSQLFDGFVALEKAMEQDFGYDSEEDELQERDSDAQAELEAAIITEVRATLDSVIDAEDYSPDFIASCLSALTEALEEIDPDVFAQGDDDDIMSTEEEDDDEDYEDIDDYDDDEEYEDDDDDYDDDEYEDEEYEDDDEDDD